MDTEQLAVNTVKTLAMDGVQAANSGHPGMPLGMADIAVVLWGNHLVVDPASSEWPDRDRFVLSNGHGSMLLYALLHLAGFPLSMDDLRNFRQLGHPTAGHPERDSRLGIETTTGPLGQGFGTGVGLAAAEAHLRAIFGHDLVDHRTYGFVSDGDLMEGISSEAGSLAGHLGLGRLIYLYDDNEISIGGSTDVTFTEDVASRFGALGWHTLDIDGHDRWAIDEAITDAKSAVDRPSLIVCHTHIAHGAPTLQDTADSHGKPLGAAEIEATKAAMGWAPDVEFHVPAEVSAFFAEAMRRGADARAAWEARRDQSFASDHALAGRWAHHWDSNPVTVADLGYEVGDSVATRKASGRAINQIAAQFSALVGGSADLEPSTNTLIDGGGEMQASTPGGRNIRFGVREHAMGTIVNGMAIHGGLRPFGATFLVFSDYMRPALRLSALMGAPSIWVYTHDSVWLGEDGPTHQPIEHLTSLRAMPNMWVVRPADAGETAEAWEVALDRADGPTCIVLTRQGLPVLDRAALAGSVRLGGYIVRQGTDAVLIATGSEVALALSAADVLLEAGHTVRVVSMPCVEAFDIQDDAYRASVLGVGLPIVTIEAGATLGWHRFAGDRGITIGVDHFGASAPRQDLADLWGFTPARIAERVEVLLS